MSTTDEDGYVSAARSVALARNEQRECRQTIRAKLRASPLMDEPQFVRELERAYERLTG